MTRDRMAWVGALVAQSADITTTAAALEVGGREANPIMAAVLDAAGFPGAIGVHILVLACAGALWWGSRRAGVPATVLVPTIMGLVGAIPAAVNGAQLAGVVA